MVTKLAGPKYIILQCCHDVAQRDLYSLLALAEYNLFRGFEKGTGEGQPQQTLNSDTILTMYAQQYAKQYPKQYASE